jgi:hypothetical protein
MMKREDPDQLDADGQPTNSWQKGVKIMNAERDENQLQQGQNWSWGKRNLRMIH